MAEKNGTLIGRDTWLQIERIIWMLKRSFCDPGVPAGINDQRGWRSAQARDKRAVIGLQAAQITRQNAEPALNEQSIEDQLTRIRGIRRSCPTHGDIPIDMRAQLIGSELADGCG